MLKSHWEEFMVLIRAKSLHVEALLKSSQPVGIKQDKVILGFFYPFHKGQIENARNREMVIEALSQVLGQPTAVQCILLPERTPERTPERKERKASAPTQSGPAGEDPVIRLAREMGAEVSSPTPTVSGQAGEEGTGDG